MIKSKVLDTYSPIIIPVSFIFGLNFIENDLIYNRFSMLGIILIATSISIFIERVEKSENDEIFAVGGGLFGVSYLMLKYLPSLYKTSILSMFISLILIGKGVVKYDIYDTNVQQIYFSLFVLFLYFALMIPNEYKIGSLGIAIPSIFYTILVLNCIKFNNLSNKN